MAADSEAADAAGEAVGRALWSGRTGVVVAAACVAALLSGCAEQAPSCRIAAADFADVRAGNAGNSPAGGSPPLWSRTEVSELLWAEIDDVDVADWRFPEQLEEMKELLRLRAADVNDL